MLKTVAQFVENPVWKEFQSIRGIYGYYVAKLENKDGFFDCSFAKKYLENYSSKSKVCFLKCEKGSRRFNCRGIEFLNDNEELTSWELLIKKKDNQSDSQKENQALKQQLAEILAELEKLKNSSSSQNKQDREREMKSIFPKSEPKQLRYCKYCASKLKEISYEIIEPDKTNYLERYFCPKCCKIFHFRESKPKSTKKKSSVLDKQTAFIKNVIELRKVNPQQRINYPKHLECANCEHLIKYTSSTGNYYKDMLTGKYEETSVMVFDVNKLFLCVPCARENGFPHAQETRRDNPNIPARYWEFKFKNSKEEAPIKQREEKNNNLDEKNFPEIQPEFNLFEEKIDKLTSSLSEEQKRIFHLAVKEQVNLFFTGAAGTGKSFLLKKIITALELLHGQKKVAVTALTGIADNNINGKTLHSFAGIGLGSESLTELVKEVQNSKLHQSRWQTAKVLIIDEVSMLEGDLLDKLEFIARTVRNNQAPFGGLQLILTGDFFQLPPVSRSNHFKFSFEAQSWKKCLNHSILLTKIHRQTENRLIELLNEIRFGEISPIGLTMLKELEQEPKYPADGIKPTQLYATNEEVNKVNQVELTKISYKSYFYHAIDWEGPNNRLSELLRKCLAPNELELKLNAQVMLIKNLSIKLVNGSQGIVVDFQQKECKINSYDWESKKKKILTQTLTLPVVKFTNGIKQVIELAEWRTKIPHTNIVQTSRQQVPLILSWAITIHKSQGQSIERLKIDCQNIFAKGQLYVALSRATSVKYLQVIGFRKNHVMLSHPKVNNFYQNLLESQKGTKDY